MKNEFLQILDMRLHATEQHHEIPFFFQIIYYLYHIRHFDLSCKKIHLIALQLFVVKYNLFDLFSECMSTLNMTTATQHFFNVIWVNNPLSCLLIIGKISQAVLCMYCIYHNELTSMFCFFTSPVRGVQQFLLISQKDDDGANNSNQTKTAQITRHCHCCDLHKQSLT